MPKNSIPNKRNENPSTPTNPRNSDNIHKSYTLNPKTDSLHKEFNLTSMGHKKMHSYDMKGYKQRVRNAIISIFKMPKNKGGLLIEQLKQKLATILGGQVQIELLGENKLSEFITKEMHEQFGVHLFPNRTQNSFFNNECTYRVVPKQAFCGHMFSTYGFPYYPFNHLYNHDMSPMSNSNTPKTQDKTYTHIGHILDNNHSLNKYSRKGYSSPPGANNSFHKMAKYNSKNNFHICSMSHLSEISKNDQHEAFSMLSYGLKNDLNLLDNAPYLENERESDQNLISLQSTKAKKELGFSFRVFHSDSIQIMGDDRSHDSDYDKHFLSCKSSDDDDQKFLFDEENPKPEKKLKARKKQIRLSKSSRKNKKGHLEILEMKLLDSLDIN